jgi:drug/metabolite transporter (DMT)-like permease
MTAVLALCGGLMWGVGDFLGGLAARRITVITVVVVSQAIGLAGLLVWVLVTSDPFPGVVELLPAAAAGVTVLAGITAFYRGLAIGAMGIVAPISAAGPVVPLAVDAARGITPTPLQGLGIVLVLLGVATLSWEGSTPARGGRMAAGAGLAIVAAVGFGFFFVGVDAGSDESPTWAIIAARTMAVALGAIAALALSKPLRPPRSLLVMLAAVGLVDTSANVLIAAATTYGAAGIVAVLSSLYPVVTMMLAWRFLGERLAATKRAGGVVALAGAALVAAG